MNEREKNDAVTLKIKRRYLHVGFGLIVGFGIGYATSTSLHRRSLLPPSDAPLVTLPSFSELPTVRVVTAGRPSLGSESAPITLVEFSDYECPFCRQYFQETYKKVLSEYDGRLRYVARNFPIDEIHPLAQQAAQAAECAHEQGGFWEYHDRLFERSPSLSLPALLVYATELDLQIDEFRDCLTSGRMAEVVAKDVQDGVSYGVQATPTFFINGRRIVGALSFSEFKAYVDEALNAVGSQD